VRSGREAAREEGDDLFFEFCETLAPLRQGPTTNVSPHFDGRLSRERGALIDLVTGARDLDDGYESPIIAVETLPLDLLIAGALRHGARRLTESRGKHSRPLPLLERTADGKSA
jgi:hypothetical protein